MSKKKLSEYTDGSEVQASESSPETTEEQAIDVVERANNIAIPKSVATPEYIPTLPEDGSPFFEQVADNQVKLQSEELRKMNVFFATPCYGGVVTDQYFLSMFRLSQTMIQNGINFRITTLRNESLVTRARNILTAMFMADESATHMMFIDADIEFDAESVLRMLAMNKNITAAAYPKKTVDWNGVAKAVQAGDTDPAPAGAEYAINLKFEDKATKKVKAKDGAVEVLDASTGFFLIKKEVIKTMMESYPELHYKNDSSIDPKYNKYCYSLFDTIHDPIDNRYLSEDYTFCRRWQSLGGSIWVDPNTKLNHVGAFTFQGNLNKIFNYGP
jgi:hypothetical protein